MAARRDPPLRLERHFVSRAGRLQDRARGAQRRIFLAAPRPAQEARHHPRDHRTADRGGGPRHARGQRRSADVDRNPCRQRGRAVGGQLYGRPNRAAGRQRQRYRENSDPVDLVRRATPVNWPGEIAPGNLRPRAQRAAGGAAGTAGRRGPGALPRFVAVVPVYNHERAVPAVASDIACARTATGAGRRRIGRNLQGRPGEAGARPRRTPGTPAGEWRQGRGGDRRPAQGARARIFARAAGGCRWPA